MTAISDSTTTILLLAFSIIAIVFAYVQYHIITLTKIDNSDEVEVSSPLAKAEDGKHVNDKAQTDLLIEIYEAIRLGANAFLKAEYKICMIFCLGFCAVIIVFVSIGQDFTAGTLTGIAFLVGAVTSMMAGNIGMQVGVYSNVRTAVNAQKPGFKDCFNTAFRAGSVMGFCLNGMGLLVLYIMLCFYRIEYPTASKWAKLMECISGYGLGGSTVAMFGKLIIYQLLFIFILLYYIIIIF
jgi:inorganic pyrophosphatase